MESTRRTKQAYIFIFTIVFVETKQCYFPSVHQQLIASEQKFIEGLLHVYGRRGEGGTHVECKAH